MVEEQLRHRGLTDERLLAAFRTVPRHLFVPDEVMGEAYTDSPLSIGAGQTISQPYIVALMTHSLRLQGHERVLEVGGGSGYQSAILGELALEVYTVERLPALCQTARARLERLGFLNVHLITADGSLGWPANAPYDAILVAAAAPAIPPPLLAQLGDPGRLVLPIGPPDMQMLVEVEKHHGTIQQRAIASCMFVPLMGQHGWPS